ncbi:MAG: heparinase II/III family protein, partial [Phenylobacterium sp.]|uniref:heparinase II/III domain-containing protein n=1 Tax=Phenylobacterium sp. TaxID=1871053 RepID=UPI002733B0D3
SRSPQAALELLFDLLTLDAALMQRGVAPRDEMLRAIDRLAGAVRFFTLGDGGLPDFQGGEESRAAYVAAARVEDGGEDRPIPSARNGYHRLEGKSLQVVADAAPPAIGPWSVTACAQPLAIEVLVGRQRLIVNGGWSPDAVGPPALRVADAASTATLGDLSCGEPLRGVAASVLGPRLNGGCRHVDAYRHEAEGGRWLELSHDGWAPRFGLRHERRLYIDPATDELRGEDSFTPLTPPDAKGRKFVPFMVRFHLHPDVRVSRANDRKSVLLRAEGQETGWWLRNDAIEVEVEPSIYFQQGMPRRTSQVVLRGQVRLDSGARIRWKLAHAEAWPPPR